MLLLLHTSVAGAADTAAPIAFLERPATLPPGDVRVDAAAAGAPGAPVAPSVGAGCGLPLGLEVGATLLQAELGTDSEIGAPSLYSLVPVLAAGPLTAVLGLGATVPVSEPGGLGAALAASLAFSDRVALTATPTVETVASEPATASVPVELAAQLRQRLYLLLGGSASSDLTVVGRAAAGLTVGRRRPIDLVVGAEAEPTGAASADLAVHLWLPRARVGAPIVADDDDAPTDPSSVGP